MICWSFMWAAVLRKTWIESKAWGRCATMKDIGVQVVFSLILVGKALIESDHHWSGIADCAFTTT